MPPEPDSAAWARSIEPLPEVGCEKAAARRGGRWLARLDTGRCRTWGACVDVARVLYCLRNGVVKAAERVDEAAHRQVEQFLQLHSTVATEGLRSLRFLRLQRDLLRQLLRHV